MTPARRMIDGLYRSARGVDEGIDPDLSTPELVAFLTERAAWRLNGVVRGFPSAYLAPSVRLRGRRRLILGQGAVVAGSVLLDARSRRGIRLGRGATVDERAVLRASGVLRNLGEGIDVGDLTAIGLGNFLHGGGGITIGRACLLGPSVSIFSENHRSGERDRPIREQGETRGRVKIDDDVWIGSGSTVLAGVHIGTGSIVAAGAVVTADVESFSVVAGVPARRIGER